MKKDNPTRKINKSYHARMKQLLKGAHEREIFESLSAGKNSYMRLDRLESSSFDKSWIEMIEDCIFDLGDIIANPRQVTKTEGVITPVELARKVTGESVQHLASHTQYIKEVDEYGNVIPSKLLSMTSDDDLHTYENRFIATFVRRLLLFIEKRYEFVSKFAELHNEEVLFFKNKSIVDGAEVEIETKIKVSYKNEDEAALKSNNYVQRIAQTRQYILYFYNSPFMRALKNDKDVRNPIIQTNIIRKNLKYHHCYEVYRFIETYDRLGVNYKIDENYSLFNNEELNELNRTIFANYITLKGKEMSRTRKTNTRVYKPRILTSMDDESFIYGDLLRGPINFVRTDEAYQNYLNSKIKKDLPLHPTKKEKEYYEDEYDERNENKQDLKQKNDLIKRRQKEINAFERSVKDILIKREEARLRLLALEQEAIKKEENDLLEAMRQEIIAAARMGDSIEEEKQEEPVIEEAPIEETVIEQTKPVYVPTVTFEEAADEIWPQLKHPKSIVVSSKEENIEPIKQEEPIPSTKEQPVLSQGISFEEAINEIWPSLNKPQPIKEKVIPEVEEAIVSDNKEIKEEKPIYVPSISFEEAANEIWPQLNKPTPMVKPVEESENKVKPGKVHKVEEVITPITKEQPVINKGVTFEEAANEIWPQLNKPTPVETKQEPVKETPIKQEPLKEEKVTYSSIVSFEDAINEIWPQLNKPQPIKEKVAPVIEEKPAIKETPLVKEEKKYQPTVSFEEAANEIWPQLNKPVNQVVENKPAKKEKTIKPVVKEQEKPARRSSVSFDDAINEIWPQLSKPTPVVKEQPRVEAHVEKPVIKEPAKEKPLVATVSFEVAANEVWPQLNKPTPVTKKEQAKVEIKKEDKKVLEAPKKVNKAPAKKKEKAPKVVEPKEEIKKEEAPIRNKIPGKFIVKTNQGYYVNEKSFSNMKENAKVFDDFNLANDIKKELGGKVVKL